MFLLPVCLYIGWLSTPFRNTFSKVRGREEVYFTYLIDVPAHISFTLGVSSGGCERERRLRGTSEQFGVDQTAKAVTVPRTHSSVLIQAVVSVFGKQLTSQSGVLGLFFVFVFFPLKARGFLPERLMLGHTLGDLLGVLYPGLVVLNCM